MSPPDPAMPMLSRRHAAPVRRLVVVDVAHAARLFPERPLSLLAVEQEIARTGGAVLVLVRSPVVERVLPLANGAEIASATGTLTGAVAFQIQALDTLPPPSMPEPTSRDLHAAATDVEVDRLRRVEQAARDLLASLPSCAHHGDRPATKAVGTSESARRATPIFCDECAAAPQNDPSWLCDVTGAAAVRTLASLLAVAGERAS